MAVKYDRLLVRPTGMQLLSALEEAQAAANARPPALEVGHGEWMEAITRARGHREGACEWNEKRYCDASGVVMVWWTDHAGRRQFRVQGHHWPAHGFQKAPDLILRGHPPVWAIAPNQCFLREATGQREWVMVCGCGEVGPPERLGWMGRSCAACHDREQEGEEPAHRVRAGPAQPEAGVPAPLQFRLIEGGQPRLLQAFFSEEMKGLIYSFVGADGDLEVPGGQGKFSASGDGSCLALLGAELRVYRLRGDAYEVAWVRPDVADGGLNCPLAVSLRGGYIATAAGSSVRLFGPAGRDIAADTAAAEGPWGYSPELLCFGPEEGMVFRSASCYPRREVVEQADWAEEPDQGERRPPTLHAWRLEGGGWKLAYRLDFPGLECGLFSPCGRWYAWATYADGLSFVELATGRALGRIAAELNAPVGHVRFLDSGETLLLSQGSRSCYVPWRLLLGLSPVTGTMTA